MYADKNGTTLAVGDHVFILGHVSGITDPHAVVALTKYGQATSLQFLRTEPLKTTTTNGVVSGDPAIQINNGDDVMVIGQVTNLAQGIHDVANVQVTRNGSQETETFYCSETTKATINEPNGVVSGPTG